MANRQAATAFILTYIDKLLPGSSNSAYYKTLLENKSDRDFEAMMIRLRDGEEVLSLVVPPHSQYKLSSDRNLAIAKELGHSFFERLWLTDPHTNQTYLTPIPYLVVDLPLRRQAQTLVKKTSIPEDTGHVDLSTGQPTGPSKSAKVSFPEIQALYAQGLETTLEELVRFRGGDEAAFRAMNQQIIDTGAARMDTIQSASRAKSTVTLSVYLKTAHLDNTLGAT